MHNHPVEFSVGLGFLLGMLHAIEPGHGKTAMFVYMLRRPGTLWHPLVIGLSTAISHAFSLAMIATVVHLGTHLLAGDSHSGQVTASQALQWVSSLLLIAIGLRLFMLARCPTQVPRKCRCCGEHAAHDTTASHSVALATPQAAEACHATPFAVAQIGLTPGLSRRIGMQATETAGPPSSTPAQLRLTLLLGFAIGLLPCPTALAAYFAGLSSGDPWEGYRVIAVFSAGIAVSLAACGFILQWVGERLGRWLPDQHSARRLAYVQASLILMIGCWHLVQLYQGQAAH